MLRLSRSFLLIAAAFLSVGSVRAQDAATKWMRLWNGKDLAGWKVLASYWTVDSGMIIGKGSLPNHNTFAIPPGTFSDFEFSVKARLYERGISWYTNSGVQYRSRIADENRRILQGPQLDIGDGASASMYPEGGYGSPGASSSQACRSAMKMDEWNHYLIVANGTRVGHRLNGAVCNDFTNSIKEGVFGLQLHFVVNAQPGQTMEVNFKDVYVRPLNNSFTIPDSLAVYLDASYTATTSTVLAGKTWRDQSLRPMVRDGRLMVSGGVPGLRIDAFDPLGRALGIAPRTVGGAPVLEIGRGTSGAAILRVTSENGRSGMRMIAGH